MCSLTSFSLDCPNLRVGGVAEKHQWRFQLLECFGNLKFVDYLDLFFSENWPKREQHARDYVRKEKKRKALSPVGLNSCLFACTQFQM